jgi:hypothetical protein
MNFYKIFRGLSYLFNGSILYTVGWDLFSHVRDTLVEIDFLFIGLLVSSSISALFFNFKTRRYHPKSGYFQEGFKVGASGASRRRTFSLMAVGLINGTVSFILLTLCFAGLYYYPIKSIGWESAIRGLLYLVLISFWAIQLYYVTLFFSKGK